VEKELLSPLSRLKEINMLRDMYFTFGGTLEEVHSSSMKIIEYFDRHGAIMVFGSAFIPKRDGIYAFKQTNSSIIFYVVKIKTTIKYGRFEKLGLFHDGYTYRKKIVYSYKNDGKDIPIYSEYKEPIACNEKAKSNAKEIAEGFAKFVISQE
jgi:hypothetical protein